MGRSEWWRRMDLDYGAVFDRIFYLVMKLILKVILKDAVDAP